MRDHHDGEYVGSQKRVTHGLKALYKPTAADMAEVHAQRVSIPALAYLKRLAEVEPGDPQSMKARELLLNWSGEMDAHRVEPAIYSAMRDALLREVLNHKLGKDLAEKYGPQRALPGPAQRV